MTGVRVRDLESGRDARGAGPPGGHRHRRVDRRHARRWSASAASSACAPPRACTWWCRAAHPLRDRADPAYRDVGAVRHPVGRALDHRHHRHRLATSTGPTRPRRARTSTTCSPRSTRCWTAAHPRRTSRASTPGCGRCCPARPSRPPSCPASTPWRADARAAAGGGRQVHDVPGDGRGRRSTRVAPALAGRVPPSRTDRAAAARRRRATPRCGTRPAPTWPAGTGCTSAWSSTCSSGTARWSHEVLALVDGDPSLGGRWPGADDYLRGRGRLRRPATRAPCTSTTC